MHRNQFWTLCFGVIELMPDRTDARPEGQETLPQRERGWTANLQVWNEDSFLATSTFDSPAGGISGKPAKGEMACCANYPVPIP